MPNAGSTPEKSKKPNSKKENIPLTPPTTLTKWYLTLATIAVYVLSLFGVMNIILLQVNPALSFNETLNSEEQYLDQTSNILSFAMLSLAILISGISIISLCTKSWQFTVFPYSFVIISFLVNGCLSGMMIANSKLTPIASRIVNEYNEVLNKSRENLAEAPQTCATYLYQNAHALVKDNCFACDPGNFNWKNAMLITQVEEENWNSPVVYFTRQVIVDQIVCESALSQFIYPPMIWPWFCNTTLDLNYTTGNNWPCSPQQADMRMDYSLMPWQWTAWLGEGGNAELVLLGVYQLAVNLYAPLIVAPVALPTSECILLKGEASIRFPVTGMCGPNPFARLGLDPRFSNCVTDQFTNYQTTYANWLLDLNNTITEILKARPDRYFNYAKTSESIYWCGTFAIIIDFFIGVFFYFMAIWNDCHEERDYKKFISKNEKSPLISINA